MPVSQTGRTITGVSGMAVVDVTGISLTAAEPAPDTRLYRIRLLSPEPLGRTKAQDDIPVAVHAT